MPPLFQYIFLRLPSILARSGHKMTTSIKFTHMRGKGEIKAKLRNFYLIFG